MRIKRLLSLTLTLIILITTSFTGSLSTSAAMVTATDNHSVYSSDFSDLETLSDWCYTSEGDTTYDSLTATIEDGKFIFNNVNASGSFLRGMRYIPDKKSINQRVEITFTAQKGQKPCVWSRVNQEQMGKGNSLEGYYLMLNYNYSASTASLDLSKRVAAKNYSIATTNSVTMVDGQEYRLEMLCQGTNPTLISVALYTMVNGVDTVVCHNTFFDSEATLQTAGNAGMAGAKNGSASSDLKIDNFVYTSTDNVSGRYYVEEIVAGKNVTFGQAVYLDSTKKYVLSAHTVDVLDNNGYEYVNPLWIEYEPGGVNYRALTDRKLLSSNRSKEIATKAGITYNEYHTVFYNEFDLSELVAATDKKIKVIVGFRNDNSANTKGMFSHFSLYAADDPNKTNLLVNPDFKMGFYGWSDQAEFTKNTRMKEGESVGTYAKLSDSLSEYEYYNLFKNSTFTITEGDATGDGVVNLKDLVRTKKISSGISNYCVAVDYDSNGSISATDITFLRRQILGISFDAAKQVNVPAGDVLASETATSTVALGGEYTADYDGAAVSLATPKSLRIKVRVVNSNLENIKEYGALVALAYDLGDNELEIGNTEYAYTKAVAFSKAQGIDAAVSTSDDFAEYYIALNDIYETDYDKLFAVRPYTIDNNNNISYSETVLKSVYDVASKAAVDTTNDYSTEIRGEFCKIAENYTTDANGHPVNLSVGNMKAEEVQTDTNERVDKILTAASDYSATGTVYYVSATGNDSNSGKSADAPWKTLSKVSAASLSGGDVVLFRRGDIFRGQLAMKTGVTYSAYGEGDKPGIYGSSKNAADSSYWTRLDNSNVWVYSEELYDVGLVVFNNGESYATKVAPYFKNNVFVDADDNEFDIVTEVDKNGEFFSECDSVIENGYPVPSKAKGKLYLYCDKGNPGEVYDSIEICAYGNVITGTNTQNVIVDNLCIKYGGSHGIGTSNVSGFTVRNCEIGWIGGSVNKYSTSGKPVRYGNGVQVHSSSDGYYVENNYIYQIFDAGITHQQSNLPGKTCEFKNIEYSNNLIERCAWSVEYYMNTPDAGFTHKMSNIDISDNIMRLAGFGFGQYRDDEYHYPCHIMSWWSAALGHSNNADGETVTIKNNIFDRSAKSLIEIHAEKESSLPTLSGNTYIQNVNGIFGRYSLYEDDRSSNQNYFNNLLSFRPQRIAGENDCKLYFTDYKAEISDEVLAQASYFKENPVTGNYAFNVSLSNGKAIRYIKLLKNGVRLTNTKIASLKGQTVGEPVKIAFFSDTHFVGELTEADKTKQHLVDLYELRKNTFRGTVKSTPASLAFGDLFDRTVIGGDLFDFYSEGNINLFKATVTDKYPNALTLLGNHEASEGFSGILPETPTPLADIYADLNNRIFGYNSIKTQGGFKTLEEAEAYNDIYLAHNLVKDSYGNEKALLLLMDNQSYKYLYSDLHYSRLEFYINYAHTNKIPILIFQHTPLATGRKTEMVSPYDIINNPNGVGADYGSSSSTGYAGHSKYATQHPMTDKVYNLIVNNADVVKGIFCGHEHNNIYTEIVAKNSDGTATIIPQYNISGNYLYSNINLITVE